ncbi:hypothetical protein PIB30_070731 [Stylosanthes scabra]|uniref:Uncharacterized protein n=1 Tax=Stylosanthes scabra TaxID=79078 RepID=A0ABU6WRE2_9FABA|nr:hypothetical protein [Stylosanthes scabra]
MNETIASFEGKFKYSLSRDDMMALTPREWISNNIIDWICHTSNVCALERFRKRFYCVLTGILESIINPKNVGRYIRQNIEAGIGSEFGTNKRFFDKKEAANKE